MIIYQFLNNKNDILVALQQKNNSSNLYETIFRSFLAMSDILSELKNNNIYDQTKEFYENPNIVNALYMIEAIKKSNKIHYYAGSCEFSKLKFYDLIEDDKLLTYWKSSIDAMTLKLKNKNDNLKIKYLPRIYDYNFSIITDDFQLVKLNSDAITININIENFSVDLSEILIYTDTLSTIKNLNTDLIKTKFVNISNLKLYSADSYDCIRSLLRVVSTKYTNNVRKIFYTFANDNDITVTLLAILGDIPNESRYLW